MRSRTDHLLPLVLMLLLGGLTLWLRQLIESPQDTDPGRSAHDAVAIVERLTITQLGADGSPDYRLSARRMNHFPDDRRTELVEPRLESRREDATLTVVADRGRVEHDYKEAHFYDNVELVRHAAGQAADLRVRTEYLKVLPDQDIAKTDRHVLITQGSSSLSGVGMEYNRQSGQLRLLSSVKGSFDAKSK